MAISHKDLSDLNLKWNYQLWKYKTEYLRNVKSILQIRDMIFAYLFSDIAIDIVQ